MENREENPNPIDNQPQRAFCAFCGKPLPKNAKFCAYCGQVQVSTIAEAAQPVQVIDVQAPPKPIDKRARKRRLFFVFEIVFACLALLMFILMKLIKFKTDYVTIHFFNGAKRAVINHDLTMYKLWYGGLILAAVFMMLALVFMIMHYKFSDHFSPAGTIIVLIVGAVLLNFLIVYLSQLPKINKDHEAVKILAEKRTTKDFVPYDEDSYNK